MSRDEGIRAIPGFTGIRNDKEIAEDERARAIIKARLGIKDEPAPIDLRYIPPLNITSITAAPAKKGWKDDKEFEGYLADSAKMSAKIKKFRQDPDWVKEHNVRFPKFKTSVLPQHGVKKFNHNDPTTYPSHPDQKIALARADVIDKINDQHRDYRGKPVDKKGSLKTLQQLSDTKHYYGDQNYKSKWIFDPQTGDPVDAADPYPYKKNNAPYVKLKAAGNKPKAEEIHPADEHYMDQLNEIQKKGKSWLVKHLKKEDAAAGAKYISKEDRIQHHYDTLQAERDKRRNAKFI